MRLKAFIITLLIMVNGQNYSNADEAKSGINFYTGMFDFSDDKKDLHYSVLNIRTKIYTETHF